MARSVCAILVLGFLAVAALSMGGAAATSKDELLSAIVRVSLLNKCGNDVRLVVGVGAGNVLDCRKGSAVCVLGPVAVKLEALNLLKVQLSVFGKDGKLLHVKVVVNIDLGLLGKLVAGVVDLVLDVVEEIVVGVEGKVIKLLCGDVLLGTVVVAL